MSIDQHISLIDLNKHFPFEIDNQLKKEICFGETLIISCGHYEGEIEEESSDSDWSCEESTENEETEEIKEEKVVEEKPVVEETKESEVVDEDEDFHFYFFPDCTKPQPPRDSMASLIEVDGMPKINPAIANRHWCTCTIDKFGKCECHSKLPCYCGAKSIRECTCSKLETICICDETKPPSTVCTCKGSKICICRPDGKILPVCTCDNVDKPCICHPDKFPTPVCICKEKPKFILEDITSESEIGLEGEDESENKGEFLNEGEHEGVVEDEGDKGENEIGIKKSTVKKPIPCECQKPGLKPRCMCIKGDVCICNENKCICGVQKTCVCEATESQELLCKIQEPVCEMDNVSICSCPTAKRECTCDPDEICECFPKKACKCGDPEKCKCFAICDCTLPCICDTVPKNRDECICLDKIKQGDDDTCIAPCSEHNKKNNKLKRARAGKYGYRWCHDVDPHHTFFGYGYGKHDKICYKEQERERIKISGLHVDTKEGGSVTQEVKVPVYKKKVRKASLDCCSAVGGISICVETLGEDKGKFLVQVVSHSSKEGAKTGSKLVSILDCNLHTLEENRSEYISKKDIIKERRSYMAICDSGYYNKVSRICGERHVVKRFYHSFEDAKNFLLEGANVVVLRYLGLRRYKGNFKTETVLMDGSICESIYVCLGVSQAIVNGKPLFVVKIERHIIEPSGRISQTLTVLTLRGYIVSHEWADNNYILHVNPLLDVVPEKDHIEPHPPLREKWREDLQLLSDYLDFKSTRSSQGARYVSESGALTETVRDYLQTLLMLRPQDALNFTRDYFGSVLSALDLPHDEYFDTCSRHVRYFFFEE